MVSELHFSRGFTLVELLIAMSLGAVITLGVISSITYLGRNLVRMSNETSLLNAANTASATLQRDIALASAVTALSNNAFTLTVATSTGGSESVTYTWDAAAGELTRSAPSHTYVVLRNITTCAFTFTDADSDPTTLPGVVRRIEFDATLSSGSATLGTGATHQLVGPAMLIASPTF